MTRFCLFQMILVFNYSEVFGLMSVLSCALKIFAYTYCPFLLLTFAYPGFMTILHHAEWIFAKSGIRYYLLKYVLAFFNAIVFTLYTVLVSYPEHTKTFAMSERLVSSDQITEEAYSYIKIWHFIWFLCSVWFLKDSWEMVSLLYRENKTLRILEKGGKKD